MPENFAKVRSYEIVRRVRCEMRDSIRAFVIKKVSDTDPQLAERLHDDTFYRGYDPRRFDPETRAGLDTYMKTLIGYSFSFDITEANNAGATADFKGTSIFRLGIGAGSERKRNNTETFRVIDTFENLTRKIDNEYCNMGRQKPNYAYPITGHLDLVHIVKTYLDLNQSGNLGGPEDTPTVPTLTETLEFTTVLTAKFNPGIETGGTANFELVQAGITSDVSRQDIHKVTIVLTLPPEGTHGLTIAEQRIDQEIRDAQDRNDTRSLTEKLNRALK